MGAGCSSPLRRLGGGSSSKRAKASRDSVCSGGPNASGRPDDHDNPVEILTIAKAKQQLKQQQRHSMSQPLDHGEHGRLEPDEHSGTYSQPAVSTTSVGYEEDTDTGGVKDHENNNNIDAQMSAQQSETHQQQQQQQAQPPLSTPNTQHQQQQQQQQPPGTTSKQRIFTIRGNHKHVVAIYPDKNRLVVWDLYKEKVVRTIEAIENPRDLRMVDQKRAVVLCNRELRVYDLNSGALLTKLKGVMNQKMPYFEIFGQQYVIALARNRMYVNMLNLQTGELETTFKVGEDRFLNSLLVSANGGICVCGDETQKPFPLLVWNLNERRLMYDLRLDRHEFITRMSAISDDGHFVVSVCKQLGYEPVNQNKSNHHHYSTSNSNSNSNSYSNLGLTTTPGLGGAAVGPLTPTPTPTPTSTPTPTPTPTPPQHNQHQISTATNGANNTNQSPNFIVIYDLKSGTLLNKWKPGLDTCAVSIWLTSNRCGKLINSIVDCSILVWDLTTGSKKHTLVGHTAPADVIQVQNNRLFSMDSTGRDSLLKIWDLHQGACLASFAPDAQVSCCALSVRGDALVCGYQQTGSGDADHRIGTHHVDEKMAPDEEAAGVATAPASGKRRKSSKSLYIFDEPPHQPPGDSPKASSGG